jgi:hypothetical protein
MFVLRVAALHMHMQVCSGAQQGPSVSEGAAGTVAGSEMKAGWAGWIRTLTGRERKAQGYFRGGEVAIIRGSRIANEFSQRGKTS